MVEVSYLFGSILTEKRKVFFFNVVWVERQQNKQICEFLLFEKDLSKQGKDRKCFRRLKHASTTWLAFFRVSSILLLSDSREVILIFYVRFSNLKDVN